MAYPPRAVISSPPRPFQPIIYAFHLVVPVLNIGQLNPYTAATTTGQWIAWIAQLAGWTLTTTVIAGVTRVLSRN